MSEVALQPSSCGPSDVHKRGFVSVTKPAHCRQQLREACTRTKKGRGRGGEGKEKKRKEKGLRISIPRQF